MAQGYGTTMAELDEKIGYVARFQLTFPSRVQDRSILTKTTSQGVQGIKERRHDVGSKVKKDSAFFTVMF